MNNKINNPRGTTDILPDQVLAWEQLEATARKILKCYGYREIRTPIFEEVGLFKRSLGETTEVVNKQLLEVKSQRAEEGEALFALRPEGTAPVVRAYNQNNLGREEFISKLFYIAPMFRGERPQKGRLRQFHQIGAEAIGRGANHPLLDAEMIALAIQLLKEFGLDVNSFKLRLNSLGSAEDKAKFSGWLRQELKGKIDHLGEECKNQYERNVFRLLDSKDKDCQAVIQSLEIGTRHLSESGLQYFEQVKKGLDQLGVRYEISDKMVRGLDYYTHTVFEISYAGLGAQDAIGAGGRYNGLIEQLGGGDKRFPETIGAIGFALGMERILLALDNERNKNLQPFSLSPKGIVEAFVLFNEGDEEDAFSLIHELRSEGIAADMDFGKRPWKKQHEWGVKLNADCFLNLRGDSVGVSGDAIGEILIPRSEIVKKMKEKFKKGST